MYPESQFSRFSESQPRPQACLFPPLPAEAARLLEGYGLIAAKVLNLKPKHRRELPSNIRRLSHELTDERAQGFAPKYMSDAASLSAYVAFFLPWNLYRLTRLLSGLDLDLPDGAVCVDLGSGPLTAVQALWIAKPELRQRKLHFHCLDRAARPMRVGLELFHSLVGGETPWRIDLEQGALGARLPVRADLLIAANVLNEFSTRTGEGREERMAQSLARQTTENARMLLVEPGTRTGGRLLSSLRTELAEEGFAPLAPCTHVAECPMPGTAGKAWCHFQFGVFGAPKWLLRMSEDVGFRRRGVALSFLYAGRGEAARMEAEKGGVRIISDIFELPGVGLRAGRYGCAETGLVLAAGDEQTLKRLPSGCLWRPRRQPEEPARDAKTGALVMPVEQQAEPRRATPTEEREKTRDEHKDARGREKWSKASHTPKAGKASGIVKVRNMALQAFRSAQSEGHQAGEGTRSFGRDQGRDSPGRAVKPKVGGYKDSDFKEGQSRSGKAVTGQDRFNKPAAGKPKFGKPLTGKAGPKGRKGRPQDFEASAYAGKTGYQREAEPGHKGGYKPKKADAGRGRAEDRRFEKRGTGPSEERPKAFGKGKPKTDRLKPTSQRHVQPAGKQAGKAHGSRDDRTSGRGGHAAERSGRSSKREGGRPERFEPRRDHRADDRPEQRRDLRPDERKIRGRQDADERELRERDERRPRGPKRGRGSGKGGQGRGDR